MYRLTITVLFTASFMCGRVQAQDLKGQRCHIGTLLSIDSRKELSPITSTTRIEEKDKKDKKVYTGTSTPNQQSKTIYTVQVALDGFIYSAESSPLFPLFSYKPTDLVVGDPIEACVKGKSLVLTRPDGKDFKAKITRTTRDTDAADPRERTAPQTGAPVEIISTPAGADIAIDGAYVGSTPSKIELPAGSHEVSVTKEGFKPWTRTIRVTGGQVNVKAELRQQ